ncbi:hypothetical protein [Streptomyces violascens]|uniref:hypothetical protein n=1 Tax=Streptomyces violascens TaxID=67381 RepID=UPI003654C8C2
MLDQQQYRMGQFTRQQPRFLIRRALVVPHAFRMSPMVEHAPQRGARTVVESRLRQFAELPAEQLGEAELGAIRFVGYRSRGPGKPVRRRV